MNTERARVNFIALRDMTQVQGAIFGIFWGNKGRAFDTDKLYEKLTGELTDEEAAKEDADKEEKRVKRAITAGIKFLTDSNTIILKENEDKKAPKAYLMEEYNITDLSEDAQLGLQGKVHTTLTKNSETIFFKGDGIVYMPHPGSVEGKAGKKIAVGTIKNYHVNEEGFLYANIIKPIPEGSPEGTKAKGGAVKLSKVQLLDMAMPEGTPEVCVTYKKQANTKAPAITPMGDTSKGSHIVFVKALGSPGSLQVSQVLAGLEKAKQLKGATVHTIDSDHQPEVVKGLNLRSNASLILIKDGKEVARQVGPISAENMSEAYAKFISKLAPAKKAKAAK